MPRPTSTTTSASRSCPGTRSSASSTTGRRVVIEPVLGHAARGFAPPFPDAAPGDGDDYAHLATGHLEPGIQTGFCCSTGGGWAPWFWAHESQLHPVPDDDARRAGRARRAARRRRSTPPCWRGRRSPTSVSRSSPCSAPARWDWPRSPVCGATCPTCGSSSAPATRTRWRSPRRSARTWWSRRPKLDRAVRREAGCHLIGDTLSSGAHVTIDAVGSDESITDALRITRPVGGSCCSACPPTCGST